MMTLNAIRNKYAGYQLMVIDAQDFCWDNSFDDNNWWEVSEGWHTETEETNEYNVIKVEFYEEEKMVCLTIDGEL